MDTYGGYLLEVNGLILYDLSTGERHIRKQMGRREMEEIFTYFQQWDVEIMAQFDDGLFDYNPKSVLQEKASYRREHKLPEDFPWTGGAFALLADNRKGYPHIYYIDSWKEIDRSINKVSIAYHADVMAQVSAQAKKDLKDSYWLGLTTPKWLELMPLGITKGSGLQALTELLHIPMANVMAFGDGENDIEMLQAAGIGIAMENAMEEVKAAADDITADNNNDGIAAALRKYFM